MKLDSTDLKEVKFGDEIILASTLNNVFKNIDISENGLSTVNISTDNLYVSNIEVISLIKGLQKEVDFLINLHKLEEPLCFTAVDAGATIAFNKVGSPDEASIVYATESSEQNGALDWQPYKFNSVITLANVGDKVYFRAADENDISFYKTDENCYKFITTDGKKIAASGNIQTLMKADGSRLNISGKTYCYRQMFENCTSLIQSPELPATTLADRCYDNMFYGCTSLTSAPELPANTLAERCYVGMFAGCTSLTQTPRLPATTLASECYLAMFLGCTSLTTAPELPATTLEFHCYDSMFYGCTSLTQTPRLPATVLADSCYAIMFANCTSLTTAPTITTYTSNLNAFYSTLNVFDYANGSWGQLTYCNWPDLTLSEAESMVLTENIFGYNNPGDGVRISITCNNGEGVAYYDSEKSSWVFEYQSTEET